MKLKHSLTGLLILIGLTLLSLLMVQGSKERVQAQESAWGKPPSGRAVYRVIERPSAFPAGSGPGWPASISNTLKSTQALSFAIELRAVPSEVDSGHEVEYIIRYTVNHEAADNVVITSSIPLIDQDCNGNPIFARYQYSNPPGSYWHDQVRWDLGRVAEGTTSEVKFVVWIPDDPLDGTTFTNRAFIQNNKTKAASEVVTTTLHTEVANSIGIWPPNFVRPGDTFCIPIDFYNGGSSRDFNLTLNHQHQPTVMTFISATIPYTYRDNRVTWQRSCLPAGWGKRYKTTLQAASSPLITVGEVISHHFAYDTDLAPPWSQDRNQTIDLGPYAGYVGSGQHIPHSIRVKYVFQFNDDTTWPLDDLDFYARVPVGATFVWFNTHGLYPPSPYPANRFRCVPPIITAQVNNDPSLTTPPPLTSSTWLSYALHQPDPHAAPGTTWVHLQAGPIDWKWGFELIVDYTGLSSGTVITTTGSYTSNQINGAITIPFVIPAFEFEKYGPYVINATDEMFYNLRVQNVSGVDAFDIVISDTLPAETTFIDAGEAGSYDATAHQVTWAFDQMASGQEERPAVRVKVKRGLLDKTTMLNQAEMTFAGRSGPPLQDSQTTLVRSYPFFQVTHRPEKLYVPSGGLITYTVTYRNEGTGAANDALVTSLIPDKTVFVSATTPNGERLSHDAGKIYWTRPISVPVDIDQKVQFIVRNQPPSPDGTIITNVVFISSSQSLPAISNLTVVTVGLPTPTPTFTPTPTPTPTSPPSDEPTPASAPTSEGDAPPPTHTPLPPPSPTPSSTPAWPSQLPETGQTGFNPGPRAVTIIAGGLLMLVGLGIGYNLRRLWLRKG